MAGSAPTIIIVAKNEEKEEVSVEMSFEAFARTRDKNSLEITRFETPADNPKLRKAYLF